MNGLGEMCQTLSVEMNETYSLIATTFKLSI